MGDAGGPGSARKCPGVALADLGDTEGFEKGGEEGKLYAFIRWRLLGASGSPSRTPFKKRAG